MAGNVGECTENTCLWTIKIGDMHTKTIQLPCIKLLENSQIRLVFTIKNSLSSIIDRLPVSNTYMEHIVKVELWQRIWNKTWVCFPGLNVTFRKHELFFVFLFVCLFLFGGYFWERENMREWGWGWGWGGAEEEAESQADSVRSVEPHMGLDLKTVRAWPELNWESDIQPAVPPRCPRTCEILRKSITVPSSWSMKSK